MHHLHAHAFEQAEAHPAHGDHRSLYVLTVVMGLLIGGDVVFGALGWESWRAPGGIGLALVAAVLGGVRIVYGAIDALAHGRIGADIALAQACLAALVIGQPFVAAEVVFIALVGEVLEAVTFARTERAIGRLLEQTPRIARVRRDGVEARSTSSASSRSRPRRWGTTRPSARCSGWWPRRSGGRRRWSARPTGWRATSCPWSRSSPA
jgi:cation transport ATPase